MKSIFVSLLLMPTFSLAASLEPGRPALAQYGIHCAGKSSSPQGTLNADFAGTISVFSQRQTGTLKLGSIGVFNFIADFNFYLNPKNNGVVSFAFQNAGRVTLSRNSIELPKSGTVTTAVYYYDTAANTTANVVCTVASR